MGGRRSQEAGLSFEGVPGCFALGSLRYLLGGGEMVQTISVCLLKVQTLSRSSNSNHQTPFLKCRLSDAAALWDDITESPTAYYVHHAVKPTGKQLSIFTFSMRKITTFTQKKERKAAKIW